MPKHAVYIIPLLTLSVLLPLNGARAQNSDDFSDILGPLLEEMGGSGSIGEGDSVNEMLKTLQNQIDQGQKAVDRQASSGFSLSVSPRFPEANQEVSFEISGFGINLDEAFYTWFIDGIEVASGYGRTQVQHTLGGIGEPTRVRVAIRPVQGSAIERQRVVVPSSIDILWEAIDSQTPPFYRGKALPSYDSIIKLTTISNLYGGNGTLPDPQSAVYTWEKNGRKRDLADYSGFGGSTAYMLGDFLNVSQHASVEITNQASGLRASEDVNIRLVDPRLVLYEKHPLNGIVYERALSSDGVVVEDGIRIVAEPFFMDERDPFDIDFTWEVNNSTLSNRARMNQGEIQFLTETGQSGRSELSVEAENPDKMLQRDERDIQFEIQ